jgi:hypothetical protein
MNDALTADASTSFQAKFDQNNCAKDTSSVSLFQSFDGLNSIQKLDRFSSDCNRTWWPTRARYYPESATESQCCHAPRGQSTGTSLLLGTFSVACTPQFFTLFQADLSKENLEHLSLYARFPFLFPPKHVLILDPSQTAIPLHTPAKHCFVLVPKDRLYPVPSTSSVHTQKHLFLTQPQAPLSVLATIPLRSPHLRRHDEELPPQRLQSRQLVPPLVHVVPAQSAPVTPLEDKARQRPFLVLIPPPLERVFWRDDHSLLALDPHRSVLRVTLTEE